MTEALGELVIRQARTADLDEYLGLDRVADNEALNEYHARADFGYRGRVNVGGLDVGLYEKEVGA